MSQSDRAIKKLATQLARLDREVKSWRGAQADFTSIENGGNFTFKDGDGNVTAIMGGQDDGSNTIRHVDGPTPPIPSGLSAHVDGPIVQVSWDGTFEDADEATYDWSHLEVVAVGPSNEQLTATINDVTGASASVAATASGEWTVVARSVSRAEKRSLDGDAGTVTVEVVDLSGAIEAAIGSANGKNTVHYSEAPPTPADEGVLGDTWFVNQVNPETGTMLITEQWQYVTEWVQTELNHQVIATVDLGKATVGELDGIRIMGQTVRGEQLSGDAIDGKVITGATYRTTGGTGSWSDAGLFISQPDGTSMVRFPTDGSPLSLTASDTQIERATVAELDLANGAVRSGGQLALASGVTPPASPPELTAGWDMTVNLPRPPEPRMDWNGFAAWGDKWVRGVNVLGGGEGDRLEVYNADGTLNKTIPILIDPRHDLTVIGDVCYVFGKDHVVTANDVYCFAYNLTTGARVARWQFLTNAPSQKIGVTSVGSDLLTAQVSASGDTLIVNRRDASTGLVIESSPTGLAVWDLSYTRDVQGIHWDGTDLYVAHRASTRVYTYSGSGYTRKAGSSNGTQWAGWENPNRNAGGMVFVGGVPVVVSGAVYKGSAAASDYTSEMCFTWYDGTHETTASPVAVVDVAARETVTVSLPVRAGLQKRLYARSQGGTNWSRATIAADVTTSPRPVGIALYAPPTTNSFPNADPATLKSTNDKFEVKGDGSGHWGPLTFNADGTITGIPRTAAGSFTYGSIDSGQQHERTITLPAGRFTQPPSVTANSASPRTPPAIDQITTTSFRIRLYNITNLSAPNNDTTWTAVQEG